MLHWLPRLMLACLAASCARPLPQPHSHHPSESAVAVPLMDDLGSHHHPITTDSPEAQRYFDQGLRLIYAFNHDEAIRSFQQAIRLDPKCAMAYWGIGFAHGPNYNLPLDDERHRVAHDATQKAIALLSHVTEKERDYIGALGKRYSLDPTADRKALDRAFADAMRELSRRYPDDLDAATLFAESLMDLRPWDLWTLDGKPQPGTLEIVATLEKVLEKEPSHPGANHYYIHTVEASPDPERALPSAQRLHTLVPGAGHLVHMPAHIYMRVGRYADATETNRHAVAVDRAYMAKLEPQGVYPMMYYPHNIHFLWAAASMEGRSADALQAARELADSISPEMVRGMPMLEYFTPTPFFALARFGRWDDLLALPSPPAEQSYTRAMWHYGRGLALAAKNRLDGAVAEQRGLAAIAAETPEDRIVGDNTPAKKMLQLATAHLSGEIAAAQRRIGNAVARLEEAVRLQDGLPYTEPPPWYFPVRQSLGAVLLASGRAKEAEAVYRQDLERNPENGWSLLGLAQSLRAQKKDAADAEARFRRAWARADVTLTASRF
jgi:tetratricopeptide (TPR) repeat protein